MSAGKKIWLNECQKENVIEDLHLISGNIKMVQFFPIKKL